MLDLNALNQLKSLKETINEAKPRFTGTVRGTAQRFGFVNTDDGASYYLPQEQMERVFPNDVVQFCLSKDKDGKEIAEIEELVESPLSEFVGSYIVKGKAHCVAPDTQGLSRWIFIPPKKRQNAEEGDFIRCKIIQHPYKNEGKAQAEILEVIGAPDAARIEHEYVFNKYAIEPQFSSDENQQADEIAALSHDKADRVDLTHLPFCTIDSASTEDMDDAFYAEQTDGGYQIYIAIADPSAFISADSVLDKTAQTRVSSGYFPATVVRMLPSNLTNDQFSLRANQDRLALVVSIKLNDDGEVQEYEFIDAIIHSQGKLSYEQVANCFDSNDFSEFSAELSQSLKTAERASLKRLFWRKANCIIPPERADYRLKTDERWKLVEVVKQERLLSHQIIEEFMLLANVCAAEYLTEHQAGAFQTNAGLREDKFEEIEILCRQHWQIECPDLHQPNAYKMLLERLNHNPVAQKILSKCFSRTETKAESAPHNLMGFNAYTTITSPIRRYLDLHLHRVIRAIRDQQTVPSISVAQLEQMNNQGRNLRQASNELESWLIRQFLAGKQGQSMQGEVQHITNAGLAVTLDAVGINGFVVTKHIEPELKFNGLTYTISNENMKFELGDKLEVVLKKVDFERKNIILGLAK